MTRVIYGIWDGNVIDNRGKKTAQSSEDDADLPGFDEFNEDNPIRAFFGDKGFYVFDENTSLTDGLYKQMGRAAAESCGKCSPCRMGTQIIRDYLDDLRQGRGGPELWDEIEPLAVQIEETSLCGLGQTCAEALIGAIHHFREVLNQEAVGPPVEEQNGITYVTAPCIEACPSRVNVPRYIDYIKDGRPDHSLGVILQKYPMAATCGRVCVRFCEMACRRQFVDEAVGIKTLKRYVADHQESPNSVLFSKDMAMRHLPEDMRVAIVGSGPAGLSCAYHLLLRGFQVDVLESADKTGGMAVCGIPNYRLPKHILKAETDIIEHLGGRFLCGKRLGKDYTLDDLFDQDYKAVFLSIGCSEGTLLGVENEDPTLDGYETGIDFLIKIHRHVDGLEKVELSGPVVVVGGGNVAMDCARSARRLGAKEVHVIYRRTKEDMPADHEEIEAAEKEGVHFHFLVNPTQIFSKEGAVSGVELIKMKQTVPDHKGRMGVKPEEGTEYAFDCAHVIAAIGQRVPKDILKPADGVALNNWGLIKADKATLATSREGVFAGGDCVSGPSTVISAMANGLKAARSIEGHVRFHHIRYSPRSRMREILRDHEFLSKPYLDVPVKHQYRVHIPEIDPDVRTGVFDEVEQTITEEDAYREANRCLRCYRTYAVVTENPIPDLADKVVSAQELSTGDSDRF